MLKAKFLKYSTKTMPTKCSFFFHDLNFRPKSLPLFLYCELGCVNKKEI